MVQKSTDSYARIEPNVKGQVEEIPFDVTLLPNKAVDLSSLSTAALSEELEKGYADMKAEKTKTAKEVFTNIRKDFGV